MTRNEQRGYLGQLRDPELIYNKPGIERRLKEVWEKAKLNGDIDLSYEAGQKWRTARIMREDREWIDSGNKGLSPQGFPYSSKTDPIYQP